MIEIDGAPAKARSRPTIDDDGWTATVTVPETATAIVVRHADAEGSAKAWQLAIDRIALTPTVDRIRQELPDFGAPDRTPALLRAIDELDRAAPGLDPAERHEARKLGMKVAFNAGEVDRAVALGQRALREALEANQIFHAIDIGEILLHMTADDAEKEWILRVLESSIRVAGDVQHEVRWRHARAYRAKERGEIGSALDDYERSERQARRLGLVTDELIAVGARSGVLALIGDAEASETANERILELIIGRPREEACTDAAVLLGAAWNLVMRRLLGDLGTDPTVVLNRAARYYGPNGGCEVGDNPTLQQGLTELRLYFARDAITRADVDASRLAIDAIDRGALTDNQRRWLAYCDADLAMRTGDSAGALRLTEGLTRAAAEQPLLAWKTALLRADLRAANGDIDGALSEALAAEAVLDRAASQLAPDQGREGMAATLEVSAARAIELHLAKGNIAAAAATARRARARRLRPVGSVAMVASLTPEARTRYQLARARYSELAEELDASLTEAWRLPSEDRARAAHRHVELQDGMRSALKAGDALLRESTQASAPLSPAVPGELSLLYHPVSDGWVAFAITDQRIDFHRFTLPANMTGEAASAALLVPFSDAIAAASRVRVLAVGELLSARIHTLPWNAEPLVIHKPVAYGLDLEGSPVARLGNHDALVVADPATRVEGLARLPLAAAEGAAVQSRLRALGWNVIVLMDEQAEHESVIAALQRADWLHYAGHGVAAGRSGWDSALPLTGEASLDVRDILSAPRVPSAIVLSACETAGTQNARGASTQISTAFLLAGSEFVVAAQGVVADEAASRFSAALYGAAGGDLRGPELVRNAVLTLRDAGEPMSTWAGFHVWVR